MGVLNWILKEEFGFWGIRMGWDWTGLEAGIGKL